MLKQTEKRGQRTREYFKTLSAPWYKPQSYTEFRTKRSVYFHQKYSILFIPLPPKRLLLFSLNNFGRISNKSLGSLGVNVH